MVQIDLNETESNLCPPNFYSPLPLPGGGGRRQSGREQTTHRARAAAAGAGAGATAAAKKIPRPMSRGRRRVRFSARRITVERASGIATTTLQRNFQNSVML